MDTKVNILLVDDHSLILSGICRIIEQMPEVARTWAYTDSRDALQAIEMRPFDIYILDIELPNVGGFELIERIRSKEPNARIIINTMHEKVWIINKLINCEVNAIILKSSDSNVVQHAIRAVMSDHSYCCPRFEHLSRKLRNGRNDELPADVPTKRELEVLKHLSTGNSSPQIAILLGISENTVETYRKQLFLKFGARNAIDLVVKAVSKGWITIEM